MMKKYIVGAMHLNYPIKYSAILRTGVRVGLVAFCLMFATIDAQAQRSVDDSQNNSFEWTAPDAPSNGSTPPTPPTPPGDAPVQTPIDGGLGFLLAAGGAYAVRRLRKENDGTTKNDVF